MNKATQNKLFTALQRAMLLLMFLVFCVWVVVLAPLVLAGIAITFAVVFVMGGIAHAIVSLANRLSSRSP